MSIANSPSPVRRLLKEGRQSIDCSPECHSRSPTKYTPEKLSPEKNSKADDSAPILRIKRTSTLMKAKTTQLDSVPQTPEKKKRNISINEGKLNTTKTKLNTSSKRQTIKASSIVKPKNVANLAITAAKTNLQL